MATGSCRPTTCWTSCGFGTPPNEATAWFKTIQNNLFHTNTVAKPRGLLTFVKAQEQVPLNQIASLPGPLRGRAFFVSIPNLRDKR